MRTRHVLASLGLGLVVLTLGAIGCNDSDEMGGTSHVRVMLTDAPSDLIASAMVTISRVYLVGDEDGAVDVLPVSEGPVTYDLLDLRNGVEALLADRPVPAGTYGQLRLVVEDAEVTLVDGLTFADGTSTRTLFVPSGEQSGIKVLLASPLDAEPGEITIVVVDFDVNQNFVLRGSDTSATEIAEILFTPVLQEKRREEAPAP